MVLSLIVETPGNQPRIFACSADPARSQPAPQPLRGLRRVSPNIVPEVGDAARFGICRAGFPIVHQMNLGLMGKDGLRTGKIKIRPRVELKCLCFLTAVEGKVFLGLK